MRRLVLIAWWVLTPTFSSACFAQDSNFDLEGAVTKQAPGKLTVDSGQGVIFRVTYDEKTSVVMSDGSAGSGKELKLGVRVHVVGDLQDSGEIKAERIEIKSPKTPPSN